MKRRGGKPVRGLGRRALRKVSPEDAARQLEETRLLLELARTTASTLDLVSILEGACGVLTRLLGVSHALVLLWDADRRHLVGAAASPSVRDGFTRVELSLDAPGLAAEVARSRRVVEVTDAAAASGATAGVEQMHARALLGLPLTVRGELVAVVVLGKRAPVTEFPRGLIQLAQAAVGQLALSIENARLYASLKQSYAELAAARAEVVKRERLAALGELSAVVAHEVRNPLGALTNALAALRTRIPSSGDPALLVSMMSEETDRLNRIVGDLLDFARPRTPELELEDMGKLIEESVEAARASLRPESPPVEFAVALSGRLPRAPVDRRLFRQALLNVTLNAADAMPAGGLVHVSADREERAGRHFIRVDVVDSGTGMPPERLPRIFEPFFTTKAQGTGLGLAVVKRILEEHRGELEVDSYPGQGTRVTFLFPVLEGTARA